MAHSQHFLVTGAAGFVGSHLVKRLLSDGHRVVGLDDLSTGTTENLASLRPACETGNSGSDSDRFVFLEGDAAQTLQGSLPGPPIDGVFHLAASVGVGRIVASPAVSAENNLDQTRAAFDFARRVGARFVFTSSSEVYGRCPVLPCREDADLVFGPTTSTRWSYGLAKALDEHLVLDASRRMRQGVVVARLFNTVGPRQAGRDGMVLPRFVEAAVTNREIFVHGDGSQSRCFCDVRDTADALARLGTSKNKAASGVFNVGGDEPIRILDLARLVQERAKLMGMAGGTICHRPYEEVYGANFEDPRQRVPHLDRVRQAIEWLPKISLTTTIDELLSAASGEIPSGTSPALLRGATL